MKKNEKKKTNKKLLSAFGMFMLSGAMLGTATYAWFTMSREVEVKNIQMTATTPEDVQLSLGRIGTDSTTAEISGNGVSLTKSTGVLVGATAAPHNGTVLDPANDWDWSNLADISSYYAIGKLIPASSINGNNIIFTPDANGVGKTISSGAQFIQADQTVNGEAGAADSGSSVGYKTTLYAYSTTNKTNADISSAWDGGSGATSYNATYDDGYYVDIPVWLRTSSTEGAALAVKAYVKPKNADTLANSDGEALYRAVRVAILNPEGGQTGSGASVTPTGLLPVADGWENMTAAASGSLMAEPFGGPSILNWYNHSGTFSSGTTTEPVAAEASGTASSRFDTSVYGEATVYNPTNPVVTLAAGQGTSYGAATKAIIRVWLEGEDPDCWNATAGQDWSINLKFYNLKNGSSNTDLNETAQ